MMEYSGCASFRGAGLKLRACAIHRLIHLVRLRELLGNSNRECSVVLTPAHHMIMANLSIFSGKRDSAGYSIAPHFAGPI